MFRRAGLRVVNNEIKCPINGSIRNNINIDVYLDDVQVGSDSTYDVSTFPVQWIQAIEVYRRVVEAPIEYQALGAGCVVLLITKG